MAAIGPPEAWLTHTPEPHASGLVNPDAPKTASEDPERALTASLLQRLLQVVAVVGFLYFAVGELFLFANKRGALILGVAGAILLLLIPEWLRRKGRVRVAAWTLVLGGTLLAAIYVFLAKNFRRVQRSMKGLLKGRNKSVRHFSPD